MDIKMRVGGWVGSLILLCFSLCAAAADKAVGATPSKAEMAQMQEAHEFATKLIAGAVGPEGRGDALITRFPANQTWVCRISVVAKEGQMAEVESRSDSASPGRACVQALLALDRRGAVQ